MSGLAVVGLFIEKVDGYLIIWNANNRNCHASPDTFLAENTL